MHCGNDSLGRFEPGTEQKMDSGQNGVRQSEDRMTTFRLCELICQDGKRFPMYLPMLGFGPPNANGLGPPNANSLETLVQKTPEVSPPSGQCGSVPRFIRQPSNLRPIDSYSQNAEMTKSSAALPASRWLSNQATLHSALSDRRGGGGGAINSCQPTTSIPVISSLPVANVRPPQSFVGFCNSFYDATAVQRLQQQEQHQQNHLGTVSYQQKQQQQLWSHLHRTDPFNPDGSSFVAPPPYSVGLSYVTGTRQSEPFSQTLSKAETTTDGRCMEFFGNPSSVVPPTGSHLPPPPPPYSHKVYQPSYRSQSQNAGPKPKYNFNVGNVSYQYSLSSKNNPQSSAVHLPDIFPSRGDGGGIPKKSYSRTPIIMRKSGIVPRAATVVGGYVKTTSEVNSTPVTVVNPISKGTFGARPVPAVTLKSTPIVKEDFTTDDGTCYTVLTYDPENTSEQSETSGGSFRAAIECGSYVTGLSQRMTEDPKSSSMEVVRRALPPAADSQSVPSLSLSDDKSCAVSASNAVGELKPTTPGQTFGTLREFGCGLVSPLDETPRVVSVESTPSSTLSAERSCVVPVPESPSSVFDESQCVELAKSVSSSALNEVPCESPFVVEAIIASASSVSPELGDSPPEDVVGNKPSDLERVTLDERQCFGALAEKASSSAKRTGQQTDETEDLERPISMSALRRKNLNLKTTDDVLEEMAMWAISKSREKVLAASEALRGRSGLDSPMIVKIEKMVVEDISLSRLEMDPMSLDDVCEPEVPQTETVPSDCKENRSRGGQQEDGSVLSSCASIQVKQEPVLEQLVQVKLEPADEVPDPIRMENAYDLVLFVKGKIDDEKVDSVFRRCSVVLETLNSRLLETGSINLKVVTKRDLFVSSISGKRKVTDAFGSQRVGVGQKRSRRIATKLAELVLFEEGGSCEWRATNRYKKRCVCCQQDDHEERS